MPLERARWFTLLEQRILRRPAEWDGYLPVLIHGDLPLASEPVEFGALGIRLEAGDVQGSILRAAPRVLRLRVALPEFTVAGVIGALGRVDRLLDVFAAAGVARGACDWWCHIAAAESFTSGRGVLDDCVPALQSLDELPREVARKLRAALRWMRRRETGIYPVDVFRDFSAAWNAFECLVEAVCLLKPPPHAEGDHRTLSMRRFIAGRGADLSLADIERCHRRYIDVGLADKAAHAFKLCLGDQAEATFRECFRAHPAREGLKAIRNAINRGDLDVDNLEERLRVEDALARLRWIDSALLARLLPIRQT